MTAEDLGRRAGLILGRDKPISSSAVRNQENGTNGIPMSVARAYGEVLKVDAQWILFGDENLSPSQEERDLAERMHREAVERGEALTIEEIRITIYGMMSGRWLPEMVPAEPQLTDTDLFVYLPGWSGTTPLVAYEVADNSLAPVYPKGSYLICAPEADVYYTDGQHIILNRRGQEGIVQCVREIRTPKAGTVEAVGIGVAALPTDVMMREDRLLRDDTWIEEVVVAALWPAPSGRGPALRMPSPEGTPSYEDWRKRPRNQLLMAGSEPILGEKK